MSDISTVLNFEGHDITMLHDESGRRMVRATDLCAPTGRKKRAVLQLVAQLDPGERCAFQMHTLGGPQEVTLLTEAGALKVLAAGRTPACARLRDVLVDYFLAARDGDSIALRHVMIELKALRSEIEGLKLPALRPLVHNSRRWGKSSLHLWTPQAEARCLRDGFTTARAYLTEVAGAPTGGPKAGGLTRRTVNLCRRNKLEVRLLVKSGQTITLLPKTALRAAHLRDASQLLLTGTDSGQLLLSATATTSAEVPRG